MAISLLGGRGRGFVLSTPPDSITRPTAVLLKRRLFDWRQHWDNLNFIDLCAGTGSMGLEALSRGASHVWLNEVNRVAFKVLEKNASNWQQKIGLLEHQRVQVMQLDFQQCLVRHKSNAAFWNEASICFFDPPWSEYALYQQFWESVQGFPGEIWVESDEQKGVSLAAQRKFLSQVIKEVTHGHHWLLVGKL